MSNASVLIICIVIMQRCMEISSFCPAADIHVTSNNSCCGLEHVTRSACGEESSIYGNVLNTTERLQKLRTVMKKANISAYIILSTDDHQSEFVAEHDRRRSFISGFTGSAGDAVVTLKSAALWTDSRYYIQAENQLDCNWILMRIGEEKTPTIDKWISEQLKPGESVSTDPRICTCQKWKNWSEKFEKSNITMKLWKHNLIDEIWSLFEERPGYPQTPVTVLDVKFAGMTWQDKITIIRQDMTKDGVDTLVLTALDEIAWILNLRSGEVPYTPVFRSYMIIEMTRTTLYMPLTKVTTEIREHLNSRNTRSGDCVRIADYFDVWSDLEKIAKTSNKIGLPSSYSYAGGVSFLICQSIPEEKAVSLTSPVLLRKNLKNEIEAAGMRNSHIRDAVALCQFLMKMETDITTGSETWTELKAVKVLDELRAKQDLSMGPSFGTISAFGKHAAMPHYEPTLESNIIIDRSNLYMVDSGGQYLDGTTDVTRTVHFGDPRQIEKEIYTRLLIGCINLVTVVFKKGYTMQQLEILVRQPLFELGLNYGHGTTHGVGSFLAVHEAFNTAYRANFFGSQEPGYYKENDFGMRLENIVTVVKANLSNTSNHDFLTFDTITLVPYERKLIIPEMLEQKHIDWLNEYHQKVREIVGAEMLRQNLQEEYNWLIEKTKPISKRNYETCD